MHTMTTHAQEAKRLLKIALSDQYVNSPAGYNASVLVTQRAQVHATLELAEQQRIANVLTLTKLNPQQCDEVTALLQSGALYALIRWVPDGHCDEYPEIRPEIADALGIEQKS